MEHKHAAVKINTDRKELSVYIHIPFCAKKCDYCDFLSAPATEEIIGKYTKALLAEIEQYEGDTEQYIVTTVFFGGGTPSVIEASYIEQIMNTLNRVFLIDKENLEATIELNPGTVNEEKLRTYRKLGINRLSFGLQSVNNQELAILGRIHTYEQFEENYHLARDLGFDNINIDLMSAIPGQTPASWENTLNQVLSLNPEHISAYSLIVEEGTNFFDRYREGSVGFQELPDEDAERLIYHSTKLILQNQGYHRYEISNYAKPSKECRHNSTYWTGKDYLGIGLGAASLLNGTRFSNVSDLGQYIKLCKNYKEGFVEKTLGKIEYNTNLEIKQEIKKEINKDIDKDIDQEIEKKINQDIMQVLNQDIILKVKKNISKENSREVKHDIMKDYIGIREEVQQLSNQQKMEEFMFLGLRLMCGISRCFFEQKFGVKIETVYGDVLNRLVDKKLITFHGDRICLTEYGIDISNYVLAEFLLE